MDLHIESKGEGQAVLFIHAGVADSRMWAGQIHGFSSTHHVIAFDKRGYGRSPWRQGSYSDTDDALAVLDHLGVESAVIVGCSMGGATALDLAIGHPDRVDGLVLVGAFPSGWVPEDGWDENPLEEEAESAYEKGDFDRVVEIDLQLWLVGYGRPSGEVPEDLKTLFRDMDHVPVATEAEREEYQTGFGKKLDEHLDEIGAPTLVIVGVHDEPLLLKAADYLADRLSSGPAILMEGAAHLPSLEQPNVFNAVLAGFLEELQSSFQIFPGQGESSARH